MNKNHFLRNISFIKKNLVDFAASCCYITSSMKQSFKGYAVVHHHHHHRGGAARVCLGRLMDS